MGLENIRVVLVNPLYGGNIGSVCRAMKNMGVTDLVIAAPREEWDYGEAVRMACHAKDVLDGRHEAPTLKEAVADCGLVAGTSCRMGLYRAHAKTPREWAPHLLAASAASRVALVFGPEDNGLALEDLALSTQIIQIPSNPECSSLNLSHAVMVCCYELFIAAQAFALPPEKSPEAPAAMRERMFEMWRQTLLDIEFMHSKKADHMMLGLRRILSRGTLTTKDIKILMGINRQMQWVADRWRQRLPPDAPPPETEIE